MLDKYPFDAIVLQNEIGPQEQILLQIAKFKKIPIFLLQHGLFFDTKRGLKCFSYNLKTYNNKRTWNNAEGWANPENFNKYRW